MKDIDLRQTVLEGLIKDICRVLGVEAEYEYRFHPVRKWRFDVAFPEAMVAVEIEGGVWSYGRHNRAATFLRDMEKYNEATMAGWSILRYTWKDVESGAIVEPICKTILRKKAVTCDETGTAGNMS